MTSALRNPALLITLGSLQATSTAQAASTSEANILIPGPSLPTLESLGWNMTYINSLPDPVLPSGDNDISIEAAAAAGCGGNYGPVSDAIVCYKFLNALGTYPCKVPDGQHSAMLAYSGNVRVEGFGVEQSSYCSDVALAVLYSIDHCTLPDQTVAGEFVANGNGNYFIAVGINA